MARGKKLVRDARASGMAATEVKGTGSQLWWRDSEVRTFLSCQVDAESKHAVESKVSAAASPSDRISEEIITVGLPSLPPVINLLTSNADNGQTTDAPM